MTTDEAKASVGKAVVYQPEGDGPEASRSGVILRVIDKVWREGYPPEHQSYVVVRLDGERRALPTAPELLTLAVPS